MGHYDDREALARLADGADVVTFEFENVPVEAARFLMELAPVFPPAEALEIAQDRVNEKALFDEVGLPTRSARTGGDAGRAPRRRSSASGRRPCSRRVGWATTARGRR